ncbi:HIT finger domain protein [Aspergillus egyptiacus]|nr:HIT finger domain protein [Aspergillus egyptiacus]
MTNLCEVCASEPFKYRCPTCGLTSCSLACTKTHKIYCAPKAPSSKSSSEPINAPESDQAHEPVAGNDGQKARTCPDSSPQSMSSQLKDLLNEYPPLRDQLRDIYTATLQEQWVERPGNEKLRHPRRGRQLQRNLGPWTREKGFNRGLGKVRKYRGGCEDGLETGKGAEGFMRLLALVNGESHLQDP